MYACVENPKTSHYVMVLMLARVLDQEFSKLPTTASLHFADVNTVTMKLESAMERTAACDRENLV
jgi:hypothetical protein